MVESAPQPVGAPRQIPSPVPGPTDLQGPAENSFRQWLVENKPPWDLHTNQPPYDMRGFWQSLSQGHPEAMLAMGQQPFPFPGQWAMPGHPNFVQG